MTPDQFIAGIAGAESRSNPVAWGDAGRGCGMYQAHPDWVMTWSVRLSVPAIVGDSWNTFIERIIRAFFTHCLGTVKIDAVQAAMYYHRGHVVLEGDPDWDQDYADRFARYAALAVTG